MQTNIRSIVLPVKDLDRAVKFYEGIDLKIDNRFDDDGIAFVDCGGAQLWLVVLPDLTPANYPVCIFNIADVEEARQRVESIGGEIISELTKDGMGTYYIYKDPDGNQGEIRQPRAKKS